MQYISAIKEHEVFPVRYLILDSPQWQKHGPVPANNKFVSVTDFLTGVERDNDHTGKHFIIDVDQVVFSQSDSAVWMKHFSASLVPPQRVPHNESDYKKAMAHDRAELMSKRFNRASILRRRPSSPSLLPRFLPGFLDTSYWYTRTSTLSISVSGTVFLALSSILAILTGVSNAVETPDSNWLHWLWKTRWVSMRRVSPTHAERTSQRLDLRTSWVVKSSICVLLAAVDYISSNYYSFSPFDYLLLAANHPVRGPNDGLRLSELIPWTCAWIYLPLRFTGLLSQLLLNQRSKIYGGSYKITAAFRCICGVLELLKYVPSVIGRYDARPGLSVSRTVDLTILAAFAWQATVLPSVTETVEDEDTE
ncbi:hypothetical protein K438DRAFT_1992510 [Mycena galopus ATCC 62051]|nr:hypothetical protein K438DRAFT_1992510 [Mycena galopus ATCC 62051]